MLPLNKAPSWVYPGAKYDLDFANSRYWGGTAYRGQSTGNNAAASLLTELNGGASANSFYSPDASGILQTFPQYGLRITSGMGLWVEGNYTNYALWCRDLTNAAWTKTNITATKNQTGADGKASAATSLTASSSNGTCLQSITQSSTIFVGSAYVKRISGTGTISMTIDGGSTYTDITSQLNSSNYTKVAVASQTLANPSIGFKIGTSGDAIAVDFVQCENNSYATTPMLTTSASLGRGAEATFYMGDGTGNPNNAGQQLIRDIDNGTPATVLIQYSGNFSKQHLLHGDAISAMFVTGPASGGTIAYNSATTANSENFGLGSINKAIWRVDGTGSGICLNGGAIATSSTKVGAYSDPSHGGLGNRGIGDYPIDGYIVRVSYWRKALTDGEMIRLST